MDQFARIILGCLFLLAGIAICGISILGRGLSDSTDPATNDVRAPIAIGVACALAGIVLLLA